MSTVVDLKGWVTLDEAARRLSDIAGENVTEGDVLDFAVRKKTRLSVWFERAAGAKRLVGPSRTIALLTGNESDEWTRVEGVWSLPDHLGAGHEAIRILAHAQNGRKQVFPTHWRTIYLERDGDVYVLYDDFGEGPFDATRARPAKALSPDARFVMTSAELKVLATALAPQISAHQDSGKTDDEDEQVGDERNEPVVTLKEGKNLRAAVEAWVKLTANEIHRNGEKAEALAKRIEQIAEMNLYKSERGPINKGSILKMLPEGLTGGRGRKSTKTRKS